MAQYTAYATYIIFFQDPDEYAFALAAVGGDTIVGGRFEGAPRDAAAFFGIPFPYPSGDMASISKGLMFFAPYTPGYNIAHPSPSGIILDDTIPSFLVPGQGGVPASIWPPGPDLLLIWSGGIVRSGGPVTTDDPTPIARRRWCGGVELYPSGEGAQNFNVGAASRNASRVLGGFGLPIRGQNNSGFWNRNVNQYDTGLITETSWERFYFRIRTRPAGSPQGIWRCHGFPSNASGSALWVTSSGTVELVNLTNASVATVQASSPVIDLNEWVKVDIFLRYNNPNGNVQVYFNGSFVMGYSGLDMNNNSRHTNSDMGLWTGTGDNSVEIDLDDWTNAEWPANGAGFSLEGLDFLVGSHNRRVRSLSGTSTNWTPNAPFMANQGTGGPDQVLNSQFASSTSGALIEGVTDLSEETAIQGIELGAASAVIGTRQSNAANTDGQLGYSINGVPTMITIDGLSAIGYRSVMYRPSGQIIPASLVPFNVRYTKSADANAEVVQFVQASIEMLGIWGPEDSPDMPRLGTMDFDHNCRYTNTIWGFVGPVPDGPVYAKGGTYVGNNTQQTIDLPMACHFLWIRALTGGSSGVKWFGASVGGHLGVTERVVPNYPVDVFFDDVSQTFKFVVTGTNAEINASGVTYQYIAFCDPGLRFNVCGCWTYPNAGFTGRQQPLAVTDFQTQFGFAQKELAGVASNVIGLFCKGPGNVGEAGNGMNGSSIADFGNFATPGVFDIGVNINDSSAAGQNYSLWRMQDTNCGDQMLQIGSYTGNGAGGNRTINMPLVSGRFPLFVIVMPTNGNPGYMRDPSHTGANSAQINNLSNSTTAITGAGIDTIQVNTTLNANGVVYNFFVICGDSAGFNNGTFGPPNCLPPETPWDEPPFDPPEIAVMGEGGIAFNGQVAFTLLKDVTGIYTLVPGKTNDTLYDRQTGQPSVDMKIPDPNFKTGYIGG